MFLFAQSAVEEENKNFQNGGMTSKSVPGDCHMAPDQHPQQAVRRRSRLHRRLPSRHDARRSCYSSIYSVMAHKINEEGILLLEQPFARVSERGSSRGSTWGSCS